jgi:hypothetical protein
MWARVARGNMGPCAGELTCHRHQPAITAADFTAQYDRCLASGLKACVVFSYPAGRQILTIMCHQPTPAVITATARKHCRHHRRCRRCGIAATAVPDCPARVQPPIIAAPAVLSPTQTPLPLSSPDIASPPAKRTRRRRTELELLRDCEGNDELLVSPRLGWSTPPSLTPSSQPLRHLRRQHRY